MLQFGQKEIDRHGQAGVRGNFEADLPQQFLERDFANDAGFQQIEQIGLFDILGPIQRLVGERCHRLRVPVGVVAEGVADRRPELQRLVILDKRSCQGRVTRAGKSDIRLQNSAAKANFDRTFCRQRAVWHGICSLFVSFSPR